MFKIKKFKNLEIGQVIPMVVLMMFAIIAMVALILDGGSIISNRRTAQAAADAGALAGAQRACYGYGDAASVATIYATNNGATSVHIPLVTNSQITVVATVENDSFFARIFGVTNLTAVADATAGCYAVMGRGIVPIAFHCEADTIGGALPNPDMYDCIMLGLDWKTELKPLLSGQTKQIDGVDYSMNDTQIVNSSGVPPIDRMYIIMDDDKVCESDGGTIKCDLDGDGKDELKFGGKRGFLYPDNVNSIANFVAKGPKTDINIRSHKWLTGAQAVSTSVYNQMVSSGYVGSVVLVPVFNYLCPDDPRVGSPETNECMINAHKNPWPPYPDYGCDTSSIRGSKDNYHILAFAPFYISCISTKADCAGYQYALSMDTSGTLDKNAKIVEGFFIVNYEDILPDSTNMCDINLGNCVISLSD